MISGGMMGRLVFLLLILPLAGMVACVSNVQPPQSPVSPSLTSKISVNYSKFDPPEIMVVPGTSVTWTNTDNIPYLVADNDQLFSFSLPAGGSFSITLTEPGTYRYHCISNPFMQGTIIVLPGAST